MVAVDVLGFAALVVVAFHAQGARNEVFFDVARVHGGATEFGYLLRRRRVAHESQLCTEPLWSFRGTLYLHLKS